MSPVLDLLTAAFGLTVSVLILANLVLVIASLARRRKQALLWLAPLANVAALFLLSDSPGESAAGSGRESGTV
jgi:hypothetical protein